MDDFGQQLKERMHAETAATGPSTRFWETVAEREKTHVRQRVAWGVAGVAASIVVLALAVTMLPGIGTEEDRIPTVTGGPDAPALPSEPVVVAEGELASGETWRLEAAGPDVWPEGRGEPGELCAHLTFSGGARSVNCADPGAANIIDGHDPVFVLRGTPDAAVVEPRFASGEASRVPLQRLSTVGVSWALADLSELWLAAHDDVLTEIAVLEQNDRELFAIDVDGAALPDEEGGEPSGSVADDAGTDRQDCLADDHRRNAPPDGDDRARLYLYLGCEGEHDPNVVYRHDATSEPLGPTAFEAGQVLGELTEGLSPDLADRGYHAPALLLRAADSWSVELDGDGTLVIDLVDIDSSDVGNLNTSSASRAWHTALAANMFQFDDISTIEMRVNGSCNAYSTLFDEQGCWRIDREHAPWNTPNGAADSVADLPDGEHFGFLSAFTPTQLTFDPAEFLTGEEARAAAIEDDELSPGEELPNDFYLRDLDPTTVELPVASSIDAELIDNELTHRPVTADELEALYAGTGEASWNYGWLERLPVHLTVEDGEIVGIVEQYVP